MAPRLSWKTRIRALMTEGFEALIALFSVIGGFQYAIDPTVRANSVLKKSLGDAVIVWVMSYALAGLVMLTGLWTSRLNVEAAGLILYSTASIIETVVIFLAVGFQALLIEALLVAITLACISRLIIILKENGKEGE